MKKKKEILFLKIIQYLTNFIRSIWKLVLLKFIKNIILGLFCILNVNINNNVIINYYNEHIVGMLIGLATTITSVLVIHYFGKKLLNSIDELEKFKEDITINDDLSWFEVNKAIVVNENFKIILSTGTIVHISIIMCFGSIISITGEYTNYKEENYRKFCEDLKKISTVLL